MMTNKQLIALLPTLCIASVGNAQALYDDGTNKMDIYGRFESQITTGDESISEDGEWSGRMSARVGINLSRNLSAIEDSRVIGKSEWQVRTEGNDTRFDEGEDLQARYNYLGLEHDKFGSLVFGRTQSPMYQVMKMTDKYKNFTPGIYNYGLSKIDTSFSYNRQDATLLYSNNFDMHEIRAGYVLGNNENDVLDNGVLLSYRMNYKGDGFKISPALAYSQYKRDSESTVTSKQHDQLMAGVETNWNNFTFSIVADYVKIDMDGGSEDKYFGIDSLIAYKWGDFTFLGGYSFLDQDDEDTYEKEDWRVEGQWQLASKTYLSLTYDRELTTGNKDSEDDAVTFGLRYDF
ncbi:MAG: porin [Vibrio sp.]|uniref:porin n=1 Tax=Vibrio sp. TaxID=678 RepID=UPI003A8C2748